MGTGNPKIVGFSSNREARIDMSNAVFDNAAIAMMTGNDLIKGVKAVQHREIVAVSSNSATLKYTPASVGAILAVFKKNPDGSHGTPFDYTSSTVATGEYSISTKTLTFFAGDLTDGEEIIAYYNTNTDASAQTITISSDKFAGSFGLILDAIVKSPYDQKDYLAQINIWAAKMEDNWSVQMQSDGDPSEHTMPIEILKPAGKNEMYTITLYDENELV